MRLPLGFRDAEQFTDVLRRIQQAANTQEVVVGIRGSSTTGQNSQTGTRFGHESDFDFFLVSDILHQQALKQGAKDANGALRVGATQRYFPALAAIERELSREMSRKTTIRIFSRAGYDRVKAETDILGE